MLFLGVKSTNIWNILLGVSHLKDQLKETKPSQLLEMLVTVGGLGYMKKAPGTIGTLGAIPMTVLMILFFNEISYLIVTLIFVLISIFIVDKYEKMSEEHDQKKIVIDEVVGYMVAMASLPLTGVSLILSFILFRFFDILKPFPIGYIDKNMKGGLGVVVDDVAAGLVTNLIMQFILVKTTWLSLSLSEVLVWFNR